MRQNKYALLASLSLAFLFFACHKSDIQTTPATDDGTAAIAAVLNLPATAANYSNPALPGYLSAPPVQAQILNPGVNPVTDQGATLGRVLFYDKNLSLNKSVACASCHKQEFGFSDSAVLSKGFNGGLTGRNSMGLTDAIYYPPGSYFWDQRAASLEIQVLMPIQHPVEMGMTLSETVSRLQTLPYYHPLFKNAFGDTAISSDRIARALAQFVKAMVSYQSKYDAGRSQFPAVPAPAPNTVFPNFTSQENRGKEIFLTATGNCAPCHGTETFTAPTEKNNGIDAVTVDRGVGAIVNNTNKDATFKAPSLRNIELTAPYMHDGRFKTLEEVVEHYSTGVKNHPNLSAQLVLPNGQPRLLNLSAADKAALVAFLKTLTDRSQVSDSKFSNPFK